MHMAASNFPLESATFQSNRVIDFIKNTTFSDKKYFSNIISLWIYGRGWKGEKKILDYKKKVKSELSCKNNSLPNILAI